MEYPPAAGIGGDNPEDGFAMKAQFDQTLLSSNTTGRATSLMSAANR